MIHTQHPRLVNAMVNHPDVRPTIESGEHRLDAYDIVRDPNNVVYVNEHGVVIFLGRGNGEYDLHGGFLTPYRGKVALQDVSGAIDRLFNEHRATTIRVSIPVVLSPARFFVRRLGFRSLGVDPAKPVEHFIMEAESWAA